jgi:hypothetical protein
MATTDLLQTQGIFYFVSHKDLWRPLMSKLAPTITTAVGVTTFMFVFGYLPQAAILSIFNGPIAVVSTIMLVLSESSTITNVLARSFFIEDALLDTFDGVSHRAQSYYNKSCLSQSDSCFQKSNQHRL